MTIRTTQAKHISCVDGPRAKRRRTDANASTASSTVSELSAESAGRQAIEMLNACNLESFCQLLVRMAEHGIFELDFSHHPDATRFDDEPPFISEHGMTCPARVFERSDCRHIHVLNFRGARLGSLTAFLEVLADKQGRHLRRLDFSRTRFRLQDGREPPLQTRHFQLIAQTAANARYMVSLGLNGQSLVKGRSKSPAPVSQAQAPVVYLADETDVELPSSLPELVSAVCCASGQYEFQSLELRGCELSDADWSPLWPMLDPSSEIGVALTVPRKQLPTLDLRFNPLCSYGNRLLLMADLFQPGGTLQRLYLPDHFKDVYRQLYPQDRERFHERLERSSVQIMEPFSSALEPEFAKVKEILASHRQEYTVWAEAARTLPEAVELTVKPEDVQRC